MEIDKGVIEIIDSILNIGMVNELGISAYSNTKEDWQKAVRISIALDLIKQKDKKPTIFELTEKGIIAISDGGIENYLNNTKTEKDLDKTIKQLTSKRLKNDVYYNIMYVAIGGILALIPTVITLINSESKNSTEEKLLLQISSERNELNDNYQKRLNHKNTLILELKHEIDSLKTLKLKIK